MLCGAVNRVGEFCKRLIGKEIGDFCRHQAMRRTFPFLWLFWELRQCGVQHKVLP